MAQRREPTPREGELRAIDLDGPVCFEEWTGPPERTFVLLHGLGGSHLNWRLVAPELTERGRVLAPDLPGFGLTPRAGRSSAILANRRVLSRFLDEEATGTVVVAGNSMGGGLALLQAAFEPDSVAGIVPTSSILPRSRGARPTPIVLGGFAVYMAPGLGEWAVRQRFGRVDPERQVRFGLHLAANDPSRIPEDLVRDHVELLREHLEDPDSGSAFLEAARSIVRLISPGERYRRAIDSVRCPVLMVHGQNDRFVPVASAEAACRNHASWGLRVLPDSGHVVQMEAPDRWLAAVTRWLDEQSTGSSRS